MELNNSIAFKINDLNCEVRTLHESDVTKGYTDGLSKQTEYIENIPAHVSVSTQQQYIEGILLSNSDTISGLFIDSKLVGTAGIQSSVKFLKYVDVPAKSIATMGIFLFNMNYRGLGFGTALVWASTRLFHVCTGEEWFGAGMKKENIPSLKSFLFCGFKQVYEDEANYKVLLNYSQLTKPEFIKGEAVHGVDELVRSKRARKLT